MSAGNQTRPPLPHLQHTPCSFCLFFLLQEKPHLSQYENTWVRYKVESNGEWHTTNSYDHPHMTVKFSYSKVHSLYVDERIKDHLMNGKAIFEVSRFVCIAYLSWGGWSVAAVALTRKRQGNNTDALSMSPHFCGSQTNGSWW